MPENKQAPQDIPAVKRQWVMPLVVMFGLMTVLIANTDSVVGWIANRIFLNTQAPLSREMPRTAQSIAYMSGDVQVVGGRGEGLSCSINPVLQWLTFKRGWKTGPFAYTETTVSQQMRQACVYHDYCYRHGEATYGYSQEDCDYILLEQAYRLCLFVSAPERQPECISKARKVALGVRFGGNDSFRSAAPELSLGAGKLTKCRDGKTGVFDHDCASTYFEFDTNPITTSDYSVHRIADTPAHWLSEGALPKALYTFDIRPGGTRVTIATWKSKGAGKEPDFCTGLHLPATHGLMQSPPMVAATHKNGKRQDWFVWWRWATPDNTSGRMVVVRPSLATLTGWQSVFPGASQQEPQIVVHGGWPVIRKLATCKGFKKVITAPRSRQQKAAMNISVGSISRMRPSDNNFMQITPTPGIRTDGKLLFAAMRSHTCASGNKLCYLNLLIDPYNGAAKQLQEPLKVRDAFNQNGCDDDPDRYRNYTSTPMLFGTPENPVTAWLRRGSHNGEEFNDFVHMRRARIHNKDDVNRGNWQSRSAGIVKIPGLTEAHEPLIVYDRANRSPSIATLNLVVKPNGQATGYLTSPEREIRIDWWQLPSPSPSKSKAGETCPPQTIDQVSLQTDQLEAKNPMHIYCAQGIDPSWLSRPAIVIREEKNQPLILLQRSVIRRDGDITFDIRRVTFNRSEKHAQSAISCKVSKPKRLKLAMLSPAFLRSESCSLGRNSINGERICKARGYREVRERPLLVADLNADGIIDYVLPHGFDTSLVQMQLGGKND